MHFAPEKEIKMPSYLLSQVTVNPRDKTEILHAWSRHPTLPLAKAQAINDMKGLDWVIQKIEIVARSPQTSNP